MTALFGHDETVAQWVASKLGKPIAPPYSAIGFLSPDGTLKGGAVFHSFNGSNVEVTVYGPGAFTRRNLMIGIRYVFGQLKANRLQARRARPNRKMDKIKNFGFTFEGVSPRYFGPHKHHDAMVYRMLREDAMKWLKKEKKENGHAASAASA